MEHFCYREIANFYDRVRALLGSTESTLPDETIDYPENAPFAEQLIKRKVPKWEELDEDKRLLFETAIVFQTAIQVKPFSVGNNQIKIGQTQSLKIEYREDETGNLDDALQSTLDDLLGELDEEFSDGGLSFLSFDITNRRCRP
mgnify:FL=1